MIPTPLRRRAPTLAFALLLAHASAADEAVAQAPSGGQDNREFTARDANAQARVLALADEVLAFTGEGYKTLPPGEVLARMDGYLARMRTLAAEIADTPAAATLATFLAQFERIRADIAAVQVRERPATPGVAATPRTGDDAGPVKLRALLAEFAAANGYADLAPPQRLVALDGFLARLQALGPEVAGTPVAAVHERVLREGRQERAGIAAQVGRDAAASPAVDEGAYTDFEWMGQRAVTALTNPLQRGDFRASLDRGIDFDVGVSGIEPAPGGWLVHLSGRLGSAGTPGQGFFCHVAGGDVASLAVLRGITPPYGIVHMSAPGIGAFAMQDRPVFIRIVFDDCRVTSPTGGASRRPNLALADPKRPAPASPAAEPVRPGAPAGGSDAPVAPSPAGLRCATDPLRNGPQRAMARRLRRAWAVPEALRADPTLVLTFAVTLDFDAVLQAAPRLLRSQSQRATPQQLNAAAEAADRAIRETAPFPELGQFAGGTMQIDMTPCD